MLVIYFNLFIGCIDISGVSERTVEWQLSYGAIYLQLNGGGDGIEAFVENVQFTL